jgi:PAS domain-containing protein
MMRLAHPRGRHRTPVGAEFNSTRGPQLAFPFIDAAGRCRVRSRQPTMMLDRDLFEFLERTADAAFTVSDSGEICSWNASAERLFGFQRDGHW